MPLRPQSPLLPAAWRAFLLSLSLVGVGHAASDAEKKACLESHEGGQKLRKEGKLRAARKMFEACAQANCPPSVSSDCTKWGAEMQQSLPSIIIAARGINGKDTTAVKVLVDGEVLAEQLDGRAIEVDPGKRVLRFEHEGKFVEEHTVIRETEQNRPFSISFASPTPPPSSSAPAPARPPVPAVAPPATPPLTTEKKDTTRPSSGPPTGALVLGGVGAVLLGTAAYFGLSANARYNTLQETCAKTPVGCSEDQKSSWKTDKTAGFTTLGFGLAAVTGAGFWWAFEW